MEKLTKSDWTVKRSKWLPHLLVWLRVLGYPLSNFLHHSNTDYHNKMTVTSFFHLTLRTRSLQQQDYGTDKNYSKCLVQIIIKSTYKTWCIVSLQVVAVFVELPASREKTQKSGICQNRDQVRLEPVVDGRLALLTRSSLGGTEHPNNIKITAKIHKKTVFWGILIAWTVGTICSSLVCDGVRLANRFHVAVRLFSNRSQMTSKCGKNQKVAHEAIAECVTHVLTTFWRLLRSIPEQTHGIMKSICFI